VVKASCDGDEVAIWLRDVALEVKVPSPRHNRVGESWLADTETKDYSNYRNQYQSIITKSHFRFSPFH
jgi:hypothetical protein